MPIDTLLVFKDIHCDEQEYKLAFSRNWQYNIDINLTIITNIDVYVKNNFGYRATGKIHISLNFGQFILSQAVIQYFDSVSLVAKTKQLDAGTVTSIHMYWAFFVVGPR